MDFAFQLPTALRHKGAEGGVRAANGVGARTSPAALPRIMGAGFGLVVNATDAQVLSEASAAAEGACPF